MDDITRKRLESEREAMRTAIAVNMDSDLKTPALNAELTKMGIPDGTDLSVPSLLLGFPGGMMMRRGFSMAQVGQLMDIAMRHDAFESYDLEMLDPTGDEVDAYEDGLPEVLRCEHIRGDLSTWLRLYRNAYAELVFAIEDAADPKVSREQIQATARSVCHFMLETFWITIDPEVAS